VTLVPEETLFPVVTRSSGTSAGKAAGVPAFSLNAGSTRLQSADKLLQAPGLPEKRIPVP
jgi:hypothetical protein